MKKGTVQFIEEMISVIKVIDFPQEVIDAFRLGEDNDTAKLWFALMENRICFRFIISPQSTPKALAAPIMTFVHHGEIREKLHSTACFYLQCALERNDIKQIPALYRYFEFEYAKCMEELEEGSYNRQLIYADLINWLQHNLENYDDMVQNIPLIKNFLNIALLCSSKILENVEFQNLFRERKADFQTIHGTK